MAIDGTPTGQTRPPGQLLLSAALSICFFVAIFAVAMPVVLLNTAYTSIDPGLQPNKQHAESLLYVLSVLFFAPFAIWLAWQTTGRFISGGRGRLLEPVVSVLVAVLGFGIFLVRHSDTLPWGNGVKAILAVGLIWSVIAAVLLLGASRPGFRRPAEILERLSVPLRFLAFAGGLAAILSIVRFEPVDWKFLLAAMVVVAAATTAYANLKPRSIRRPWGLVFDLVILLLVMLSVPDMVILFTHPADFDQSFTNYIIQFHQAFYLGPANQVLHGSVLLVDSVSQYGIGSIYLIAGWFGIAPVGYLSLGFLEGLLTAFVFGLAYGTLRMSRVSRPLAAAAMLVAVVVLVWNTKYPVGALLQHGSIRFGLPMLLIAPVVAGARWPRSWPILRWVAIATVGLSSIWALEGFIYVSATAAGLILIAACWVPGPERVRWMARMSGVVVASWVATHLAFGLLTLLVSGSLPDWGLYFSYLRDFLAGDIGDFTYDVTPWSPALGVFAVYLMSGVGLSVLALGRRDLTVSHRPAILALAGLTAYGTALFSYFDNRSLDYIVTYISLPALLVIVIWLGLILDRGLSVPKAARVAAVAATCSLAALTMASAWSTAVDRSKDSLIAYLPPGGKSLGDGLHRIWNPPEFKAGSIAGQELLDEYIPGDSPVPVLTTPDLDVEILTGAGRSNQLRIGDSKEMTFVEGPNIPEVTEAVEELQPGDRMLIDSVMRSAYEEIKADPGAAYSDPDPVSNPRKLSNIQIKVLALIAQKYRLHEVAKGDDGMSIVELRDLKP